MQKNNINLKQITLNDDLEGFNVLKEIANDETNMNESPVPKEIDEYLYKGFLKLSEDELKDDAYCFRYWITLDDKIIGYADIKNPLKSDLKKIGNVGLIILKEYRNKGLGLQILKLLIEKAKNEFNLKNVIISTDENNLSMRKLCEKLDGELTITENKCNYNIK